jgi:FMN phosphatase YigB (HAD superfamily)
MARAILFDLDGTLLPVDFDQFLARYIEHVCRFYRAAANIDLRPGLKPAVASMMGNDGSRRNADVFWDTLEQHLGCDRAVLEEWYPRFIEHDGLELGHGIVPNPAASRVLEIWKTRRAKIVLATNPVFPRLLVDLRARWGALDPKHFDLITSAENMTFCKPSPNYYRSVAASIGVQPHECLMVGNDVQMDLAPAAEAGMRTCLVTGPYTVCNVPAFVPDHTCALEEVASLSDTPPLKR